MVPTMFRQRTAILGCSKGAKSWAVYKLQVGALRLAATWITLDLAPPPNNCAAEEGQSFMLIKCQGMRGNNSNQIQHYSGKFVVILSILVEEIIEISNSTIFRELDNLPIIIK